MHIFISATDHLITHTALLDHHQIKILNCTITVSLHSHIFYSIPACQLLIYSPSLQLYFNNFYIYTHSMYPPPVDGFHLILLPCSPFKAMDTRLNGLFYLSVEQQTKVWKCYALFNHSPAEGPLDFPFLTIKSKVASNTHVKSFLGFPGGTVVKNLPTNAGEVGSIPGLGRSPGEGNGNPLKYSCLANAMDRKAWWAIVQRVSENQT